MPTLDALQTIPHHGLVVADSSQCSRDIDQDRYPGVSVIYRESFFAEENRGHNTRAQVTREVRANSVARETPDHDRVRETNDKRGAGGGDERVRGVETAPDHETDEGIHKELLHEEIALVRLVGVWVGAEDGGDAAVEVHGAVGRDVGSLGGLDFRPVAAQQKTAGDEGAEDLREDVVGDFTPGEAGEEGEGEGYGWVEL